MNRMWYSLFRAAVFLTLPTCGKQWGKTFEIMKFYLKRCTVSRCLTVSEGFFDLNLILYSSTSLLLHCRWEQLSSIKRLQISRNSIERADVSAGARQWWECLRQQCSAFTDGGSKWSQWRLWIPSHSLMCLQQEWQCIPVPAAWLHNFKAVINNRDHFCVHGIEAWQ